MATLRPSPYGLTAASPMLRLAKMPQPRSCCTLPLPGLDGRSNTISIKPRDGHGIRATDAANQLAAKQEVTDEMYGVHNKFLEEQDKIDEYYAKICDTDILHLEAPLSRHLCMIAKDAVKLASIAMECEPLDALQLFFQGRVDIFVSTAEAVYHKTVTKENIVYFLRSLHDVAYMSSIAAQVPRRDLKLNSAPDCDVQKTWVEYARNMKNLISKFETAEPYDANKILKTTLTDAMALAQSFVLMSVSCKNALIPGAAMAVRDDGEAHE